MRLWILLFIFLCFNFVSAAELNTTLSLIDVSVSDNFVHNNPIITMELRNNGDGTANIKNVTLNISENYRIESSPTDIAPGRIGTFLFEVKKMDCSDLDNSYDYNVSIKYAINSTTDDFVNSSGSFQIKNSFGIDTTTRVVSARIGQIWDVPILIFNNGSEKYYYNVTMDPGFYAQISRYGNIYDVDDLDGINFSVVYADVAILKIFATEVIEESFNIKFYDVLCSNIYTQKSFFVKTYTQTGGLIDVSVTPDLDFLSVIVLLGLSILFMNKTYKTI